MADSVLFEIDAAQILAKLHLAAQSQMKGQPGFVVNTGILNNSASATPENPGKVTFDLTNKSGDYQVGYAIDFQQDSTTPHPKLIKLLDELAAIVSKTTKAPVDAKIDKNDEKQKIQLKKDIIEMFANAKKKPKDTDLDTLKGINNVKELAKSEADGLAKDYNAALEKLKANAIKNLNTYMTVFAGKDAMKGDITDAKLIWIPGNIKDASDKNLVSNYEIQEIPAEKAKVNAQQSANTDKNAIAQKACFVVQYHLDVDK